MNPKAAIPRVQREAPRIYVPEDPDELRDGLLRGFWAHRTKPPKPDEKEPRE